MRKRKHVHASNGFDGTILPENEPKAFKGNHIELKLKWYCKVDLK